MDCLAHGGSWRNGTSGVTISDSRAISDGLGIVCGYRGSPTAETELLLSSPCLIFSSLILRNGGINLQLSVTFLQGVRGRHVMQHVGS